MVVALVPGPIGGRLTRFFRCLIRIGKPFLAIEPVDALVRLSLRWGAGRFTLSSLIQRDAPGRVALEPTA